MTQQLHLGVNKVIVILIQFLTRPLTQQVVQRQPVYKFDIQRFVQVRRPSLRVISAHKSLEVDHNRAHTFTSCLSECFYVCMNPVTSRLHPEGL